jgi:hypothetical protein
MPGYTHTHTRAHADEEDEGDKGKGVSRSTITKAVREAAARIHRSSVLCLLGRTLQYDKAANDQELQASCSDVLTL